MKTDIDNSNEGATDLQVFWKNADIATKKASDYISADEATRKLIAEHDGEDKAKEAALREANAKISVEFENQKKAIRKAADQQLDEAQKKQAAAAEASEHARRYTPAGSGFNINPISNHYHGYRDHHPSRKRAHGLAHQTPMDRCM